MPAAQPRVSTVVEKRLYKALKALARRDGMTISHKARDLLLHALEIEEDAAIEEIVRTRMENRAASIPHDTFWRKRQRGVGR